MKQDLYTSPFIEEWPKISFDEFEKAEIENQAIKALYKSFFAVLHLPETTLKSFYKVLRE